MERQENWVFYKTSSKNPNIYPLQVYCFTLDSHQIPSDKEQINNLCRIGCNLYARNGGCPPFSPDYKTLSSKYKNATVVYFKLLTSHYPPKSLSGKHYVRWNFTESFMPRLLRKSLLTLANKLEGIPLFCGHCIGCRKCGYKEGSNSCKNPAERTYSLESTGVNVSNLMMLYTDSPLLWWDISNKNYLPKYQLRVGIILHNQINYREYDSSLLDALPIDHLYQPTSDDDRTRLIGNIF